MVAKLAAGPPRGLAFTKDALNREWALDLETALAHEAEVQARLMLEADFREGYRAFKEKRRPAFGAA
jgi:enoyl-CoA hydratase/carnithine racemase